MSSDISRIREVADAGGSDGAQLMPAQEWREGDLVAGPACPGHIDDVMFIDGEFEFGGGE